MTTARVATLGETMALVRTKEVGSLRHQSDLALGIGGAESNVAVALRRLGLEVSWLGRLGDDSLGERVVRELRAEGLDVHAIADGDAPTGLMIKERPRTDATAVHYYRAGSAGSRLSADDIPPGWLEDADLLHLTGITPLLSDSARDAAWTAVQRARAAGVTVSFDVNYRSALAPRERAAEVLRPFAEAADIVFGGDDELQLVTGSESGAAAAQALLDAGPGEIVRKLGAEGAESVRRDGVTHGAGFRVSVVDTVGAGDAFVAGYLSGVLTSLPVAARLERANACGALLCAAPGDWEASPTLAELATFLGPSGEPVTR